MGIDAMAHRGAGAQNTIAVLPCGIRERYPKVNAKLIEDIAKEGLVVSQFEPDFKATPWSFVVRNELVVRLGEFLIVTEAEKNSGSMRSVEIAKKIGKKIYVLPHRIGQSRGTNELAAKGEAEVIWDVEEFLNRFGSEREDETTQFLKSAPFLDEALERLGERIFELEVEGVVEIVGGKVYYKGA
jgi:DNA processing protein